MSNKKTAFVLSLALILQGLLSGCGGAPRSVQIDTGLFSSGNSDVSPQGFSGTGASESENTGATTHGFPDTGTSATGNAGAPPQGFTGTGTSPHGFTDTGNGVPATTGLSLEQMLQNGTAAQYERAVLYDPQLGCEVARTMMPQGWIAEGEVYWNGQSGTYPALYAFQIVEPNNRAKVGFVSGCDYVQPDSNFIQWQPGDIIEGFLARGKYYLTPDEYNLEMLNILNPGVNAQWSGSTVPGDGFAQYCEDLRREYQSKLDYIVSQTTGMSVQVDVVGAESIFTVDAGGLRYKAKFFSMQNITYVTTVYPLLGAKNEIRWQVPFLLYYAAEESVYDMYESEVCAMFLENFIRNAQWDSAVEQASAQIFENENNRIISQWQQTQQILQQQAAAISASSSQNYSYSGGSGSGGSSGSGSMQNAISNAMDGWTNVVTDREYFEGADGAPVLLDSSYMHTYSDGNGGFVQSNDTWDTPYGWNEVSGSPSWWD